MTVDGFLRVHFFFRIEYLHSQMNMINLFALPPHYSPPQTGATMIKGLTRFQWDKVNSTIVTVGLNQDRASNNSYKLSSAE